MQSESLKDKFLDVPTEEENELSKLLFEHFSEEDIKLNLNAANAAPKVKGIKPTPGFCVKTKDENNSKAFINICHCTDLPKPPDLSEAELLEILDSDEPSSYRVPMSIGEPHKEKDKGGNDCTCYDIIINTEYYELIKSNELFRPFLITLSFEGLQDKYGVNLDKETFLVLKHKTYHGVMPDHHIRCKPLIAELGSAPYVQKPSPSVERAPYLTETKRREIKTIRRTTYPQHVLKKFPATGYPQKIVLEVNLPNVVTSETVALSVGEDRIVLHEKTNCYDMDIFLPYLIVQEKCDAEFNVCNKILSLIMPVVQDKDENKDLEEINS